MKDLKEVQAYRDKQVLKLIEAHKDIIAKTWKIIDEDVLEGEIDKGSDRKNASESLFWEKLSRRRKGLNEVETSLDKIEKLEKTLSDYKAPEDGSTPGAEKDQLNGRVHPSKRHAKT
jgi:hypothetical protein